MMLMTFEEAISSAPVINIISLNQEEIAKSKLKASVMRIHLGKRIPEGNRVKNKRVMKGKGG